MAGCKLSVPFNMIRVGDRLVGLDAFFWPVLSERHAVVLLALPAEHLAEEPRGGTVLPLRASVWRQLEDLRGVASLVPRMPGGKGLFGLRLLSLIIPGRWVHDKVAERFVRYADQRMARDIARHLSRGEPVGKVMWLELEWARGRPSCPSSGLAERNYGFLVRVDRGFASALREVCG